MLLCFVVVCVVVVRFRFCFFGGLGFVICVVLLLLFGCCVLCVRFVFIVMFAVVCLEDCSRDRIIVVYVCVVVCLSLGVC